MKQKAFFLSLLLLLAAFYGNAQGFFNQKKAMIKKSVEQIGLLKTYTAELRSGYKIVTDGIHLAGNIKNGELMLHSHHYQSLEIVNSRIKNYPHVQETITFFNKIADAHSAVWKKVKSSEFFTEKEIRYIKGVYRNLLKAAGEDMEDIKQLTTDNELKLTDDKRLQRIDAVFKRIREKYKAITGFNAKILTVLKGRKAMQQDNRMLKKIYGQ